MAAENKTNGRIPKLFGIAVLSVFLMSCSFHPQANSEQYAELPEIAIVNLIEGIHSDNYGLKLSCIYFAGKYKVKDVSKDLVEVMKDTESDELCQMLVWSLYQIGDESCCKELKTIVENHPSEKIKDFGEYLHNINEYETAISRVKL